MMLTQQQRLSAERIISLAKEYDKGFFVNTDILEEIMRRAVSLSESLLKSPLEHLAEQAQ